MSSEEARSLRQQGIAAAKAGQKDQARQLLQQSIRIEPKNEAAWLWLASVARDQRERAFCLQKILEINPNNEQAIKALQQTQEMPAAAPAAPPPPPPSGIKRIAPAGSPPPIAPRVRTQELMSQPPGVPMAEPDLIQAAAEAAEAIAAESMTAPTSPATWVTKTRGRAGEGDIWRLRAVVGTATAAALIIIGGGLFLIAWNTPSIASVVFAPTPSLTFTPTVTLTPTPGSTPTPSVTPRFTPQPTATLPPEVPLANPYAIEATDVYPVIFSAPLADSIALIDRGDYQIALPTLAAERASTTTRFDPVPYYFEAIAQARSGDTSAALSTLEEAEGRLEEAPLERLYKPLVDAGFAYVQLLQAEAALSEAEEQQARTLLTEAQERAEAAVEIDPLLAQAHLTLARVLALQGETEAALEALDAGLSIQDLRFDTSLILEKARLYFENGEYAGAERQAFIALYIDPTIEPAYQIQVQSALEQNRPGLAVLRAQTYLFHYPGSTEGYRLLGDARVAEGNDDLALIAYSQALSVDQSEVTALRALEGRAGVYSRQGRYDLAQDDLTAALEIDSSDRIRALRLAAAVNAGDFSTAERDAQRLEESTAIDQSERSLLLARALIGRAASASQEPGSEVIGLLRDARAGATADLAPVIDEYLAQALYLNGQYGDALEAVNNALSANVSIERRYLRGLILEATNRDDDAIREYEWVVTWGTIYPTDVVEDARDRLAELS